VCLFHEVRFYDWYHFIDRFVATTLMVTGVCSLGACATMGDAGSSFDFFGDLSVTIDDFFC
jgi:hypothetical protein